MILFRNHVWPAFAVFLAVLMGASGFLWAAGELVSVKTATAPAIDGRVDSAWNNARVIEIKIDKTPYEPNNGYQGITETTVSLRSLYDSEHVYFLVQYDDPTESLERFPWVKQPDGSWKQLKATDSTGHENTYYEDKFAIYWDINAKGFDKRGCAAVCHKARNGKIAGIEDKSPARKYTAKKGQTVDMWHWKGVRSNPVGMVDDQYVDHVKDPTENRNWGRHGDSGGGGYQNNVSDDKRMPAYVGGPNSAKYWILDTEKVPFKDTFKAGDVAPGIVLSPFRGHRGDIQAKGVWADGKWTLEMKRKLVTSGGAQDVQFDDLKKTYRFGVSVFDNSQINHVYHEKAFGMTFK